MHYVVRSHKVGFRRARPKVTPEIRGKVLAVFFFSRLALVHGATDTKHYIVFMGDHSYPNSESVILANHEMLASVMGSIDGAQQAVVYHYTKSFRGFSAMLTPEHAQQLAERESVVSVFESKMNRAHTTHSWDFLGVNSIHQHNHLPLESKSDVIIGVIDSGVWPESMSFDDTGLGPIPKRFKGKCVIGEEFSLANCNRKLIGARFYYKGFEKEHGPLESINGYFLKSARDTEGHGSHTASTAAGSAVANASYLGMAKGTARGGAPNARVAIYKALWSNSGSDADLLMAFDDAISDGVDIISASIGFYPQRSFLEDPIAIGSLLAFRKGILVSASAGNDGSLYTAINVAPWILTVAASSMDREFNANVYLGNSKILKGYSLSPLKMKGSYGVINASAAAAPGVSSKDASLCQNSTLDPTLIKGKIVVCYNVDGSSESFFVKQAGAVGIIVVRPLAEGIDFGLQIPSTLIERKEAEELKAYLENERHFKKSTNYICKLLSLTRWVIFQHYIVFMGDHSYPNSESVILANHEMLASVMGSIDGAQQAVVYHYTKSFRGFSAMLTPEHAQQLAERESVVSVFESKMNRAHTTHSWDFLGVNSIHQHNHLPLESKSDVIIGVIDSGVWPESMSFDDTGLGPIPKRFKGKCVIGEEFSLANCNSLLVLGFYYKGFEKEHGPLESINGYFLKSARDTEGHGSHTASTAAGSAVANASYLGMAKGTARGGAPNARVAIYKALWSNSGSDADLLMAFDDAISDGVDIISASMALSTKKLLGGSNRHWISPSI
ncbi:hypothetical protein HHK36_018029 [Tetracentron sinense]|uniref:Uncharacterized protein n=1 Tax=Tetracentron sinense TaxID=13715 RepID=A0A834YXU2_TETSI|nr:hypothetical protein HHK36_018029 [Tetracentron sinense]